MAKHAAPQTGAAPTRPVLIRPVALTAEDYLGRLRAATTSVVQAATPGRHSRR